jgi:cell division protein FtsW (lipid II flippase)
MTDHTDQIPAGSPRSATAPSPARTRPDHRLRALGVVAAVLAPVLIWVVAVPVLGVDLLVSDGRRQSPTQFEVGLGAVVTVALGSALLGWGVLALLERFTRHARTVWTVLATVLLVLSLVPLFGPMSGATRLTLALMHLAVGAALIPAFHRSVRSPA